MKKFVNFNNFMMSVFKTIRLFIVCVFISNIGISQDFTLDNNSYKTIEWNDFFAKLEHDPNLVYFDIRTLGERCDTSEYPSMNQGKIKGSIETDFFQFEEFYPEYLKHKNETIYLYCSHSRRSRILAKQLMDSSFANVVNINGGISHLNSFSKKNIPNAESYIQTKLSYDLISPDEFVKVVNSTSAQLIDVRPDSVFKSISRSDWDNMFGVIDKALHIPFERIEENLYRLDKSKSVVLFDNDGELAPVLAVYLFNLGFKCNVLLFGLDNLITYIPEKERRFLKTNYNFQMPHDLIKLSNDNEVVLLDVRSETEFNSTDSADWKNMGRLKNAINLPLSRFSAEALKEFKGKKIVIYDIMMHEELFEVAKILSSLKFENYSLLYGGISRVWWEAYNTNSSNLKEILIR